MAKTKTSPADVRVLHDGTQVETAHLMGASHAAELARRMGRDGKQVRNYLRKKVGTYVSKRENNTLTADEKIALIERFTTAPDAD